MMVPIKFTRMSNLLWFDQPLKHKPHNMNPRILHMYGCSLKHLHSQKHFTKPTKLGHIVNTTKWYIGHQPSFTTTTNNGPS